MKPEDTGAENKPQGQQKKQDRKRLPPQLASALSSELEKALDHVQRRRILRILNRSAVDLSPAEIASAHLDGESVGRVSYHMKVLLRCQVVRETRTKPVRGATQHFYASATADDPLVISTLKATEAMDGSTADNGRSPGD